MGACPVLYVVRRMSVVPRKPDQNRQQPHLLHNKAPSSSVTPQSSVSLTLRLVLYEVVYFVITCRKLGQVSDRCNLRSALLQRAPVENTVRTMLSTLHYTTL